MCNWYSIVTVRMVCLPRLPLPRYKNEPFFSCILVATRQCNNTGINYGLTETDTTINIENASAIPGTKH